MTGTVSSGTDGTGTANVFGSGTNLAGLPFTYFLTYITNVGASGSSSCLGVPYYSYVQDSGGANPGIATLSIGSAGKSFAFGGGDGESSNGSFSLQNAAICGGSSNAGYTVTAGYGNGFSGNSYVGPSFNGADVYPATGTHLTSTADWTQPISSAALDNTKLIFFSINRILSSSGGTVAGATGYLASTNLTVINIPLNQNAETNGNPGNSSGEGLEYTVYTPESDSRGRVIGGCGVAWQQDNCNGNHQVMTIQYKSVDGPNGKIDNAPKTSCCAGPNTPTVDKGGASSVGDPINVITGNMFQEITDYKTDGPNPLTFIRTYNSMGSNVSIGGVAFTSLATTLGANWRSEYDAYLQLVYTGVTLTGVNAERPDGRVIPFTLIAPGTWGAGPSFPITLVQSGSNWTLTDIKGTVEAYTSSGTTGTLQSITLRSGYARTMSYTSGKLTTVTDSYGRTLNLSYSSGLLQSVDTPDSTTISFGYGTSGGHNVLTSVSYPTTPSTGFTYQYTDSTNPTSITNILDGASQNYATWTYDSQGRATSSKLGGTLGAQNTTLTYNTNGSVTVTNALGVADTYNFVYLHGVPKVQRISRASTATTAAATRGFGYDANGFLHSASDWNGNVTQYTNNALGLATSIVEALGYSSVTRTTTIVYDTTFPDLPDSITTTGLTSTFSYDGSGNLLSETDTDTTTQTIPYSTNGQARTTQWTWSATGQMLSVQLPRTDVTAKTSFTYDTDGALLSVTDAVGNATNITSHTGGGFPLTIVDPNSVTTTLTWDGGQRLLTSTVTTGAGNLTTTNTYDSAGNLASVEKPDGSKLTFSYDAAHRLTTIADLFGNTVNYTLDALGDATQVQVKDYFSVVAASHTATFDALGRMLTYVGGMSQTTTLTWDKNSNLLTVKDPLLNVTTMTYDHLNRLSTSVDPSPGGTTTLTYDAHDRVLSVKSPLNYTTSYVYDGFGDRIQEASPNSGTAVYHFDPDSNLTKQVLAGSLEADMTYDADDRLTATTYPADTTLNTALTYDQTTGHGFGIGRLTSATDKVGSLSLTYDERGNVTYESRIATGITTLNTTYAFDAGNNVSGITYPSGTMVLYGRDIMGRVTSVAAQPPGIGSPSNVVTSITYEPFGPVNSLSYGNGITGTYAYDNDYRPTSRVDAAASNVMNLAYTYDAADNVKTITDAVVAANGQTLGYDVLNRLTSAVSGTGGYGSMAWSWDKDHNISTQTTGGTGPTYHYTTGTDRLWWWNQGATNPTLAYTSAGNINTVTTSSVITTLTYNKANEMVSAASTGGSASYAYDLFGRRLEKAPSGGYTILFQYAGVSTLLSENDGHTDQADYIYLNGRPIGEVNPATANLYYTHTDLLGTPQYLTNGSKTVVWSATYRPFGDTQTTSGSVIQHLRYPGQYYDSETGYNHNGFRDYIPSLTRYAQADPIGLAGGINSYQYGGESPYANTDPSGLAPNPLEATCIDPAQPACWIGAGIDVAEDLWAAYRAYQTLQQATTFLNQVDDAGKANAGSSTGGGGSCPDPHDDKRKVNPTRSLSPIWQQAERYKNGLRRSGDEIWDWDNTHNDIEAYNSRGEHLGSRDPTTGQMYKPAVPGRTLNF